uniref:Uncharacterized protein n=1 Tax=Solanum tuberosum TaxID=4113 RepID=M1A9G6_SOLTU
MGDGVHNTRLKSLDEAVKQLQEQSVGHAKAVESINTALQDIVTQLASLRPSSLVPSLVAGSPSSVLGQSSVPLPQTFYQHTPPPPTLNRQPPVHQMQTSVRDYLSQFEKLANRTSDVSPPLMKHFFTSGLHPDIKSDVLAFRPADLNEAISLAFLQEQKKLAQAGTMTRPNYPSKIPASPFSFHTSPSPKNPTLSSSSSAPTASIPGVVRGVALTIQGFSFVTDFFIIDLHGSDLVLGVTWLATLGPCLTDYVNRTFEFTLDGKHHRWQGQVGQQQA